MEAEVDNGHEEMDDETKEAYLLEILAEFPLKSLKMNMDNWEKMLSIEKFKSIVLNFLNNPQLEQIYFLNVDGIILPYEKLPKTPSKSRIVLCQRIKPEVITLGNYRESVNFGDFPANTMDYLYIHTNYIQIRLLPHPKVTSQLPPIVQKEVQDNLNKLKNLIDVTEQMERGECVFPTPSSNDLSRDADLYVQQRSSDTDLHIQQASTDLTPPTTNSQNAELKAKKTALFYERIAEIKPISQITQDYGKIERLEFGDIGGKAETQTLKKILSDFQALSRKFQNLPFDIFDIDSTPHDFNCAKRQFHEECEFMDEKIATQFSRALSKCNHSSQVINILISIGDFIERPILWGRYREHFEMICELFEREIDALAEIFYGMNEKIMDGGKFLLNRTSSTHSGVFGWINQLKSILEEPFNKLPFVVDSDEIFKSEQGRRMMDKFKNLSDELREIEEMTLRTWHKDALEKLNMCYSEPLIVLDVTGIPCININHNFDVLMRDIRNIQQLKYEIPDEIGSELLERSSSFWIVKNKLLTFCEKYRFVQTQMNEFELAVIEDETRDIANDIGMLIEMDNWGEFDMNRVEGIEEKINNLHERMMKVKENMAKITEHLAEMNYPLYHRKELSSNSTISFYKRHKILPKWFWNCMKLNKLIRTVLLENFAYFTNIEYTPSSREEIELINPKTISFLRGFDSEFIKKFAEPRLEYYWREISKIGAENSSFVKYKNSIDSMVFKELAKIVRDCLNYFKEELTNAQNEKVPPFVEINLFAKGETIIFDPSIEINSPNGLFKKFRGLLHDTASILQLIVRINEESKHEMISTGKTPTFWSLQKEIDEIQKISNFVNDLISEAIGCVNECQDFFIVYESFLNLNKEMHVDEYVKNGKNFPFWNSPTASSYLSRASSDTDLVNFELGCNHEAQFAKLDVIHNVISQYETHKVCKGWLIVNSSRLRQDLLVHINQWATLLKNRLHKYVDECLREYEMFFDRALCELSGEIDLKDFEKVKNVKRIQKEIAKERDQEDDGVLFKSLIDIVNLLKSMNIQIEENILEMLENLPKKWILLERKSIEKEEEIANVLAYQRDMMKKEGILLELRLKLFAEDFENSQLFTFPCTNVYVKVDEWYEKIEKMRLYHDELGNIFKDLGVNFDQREKLKEIKKKLRNIKHLWDSVAMIEASVAEWRQTRWLVINLDEVDQECRAYLKYLRTLDKSMHQLEPFLYCDTTLRSLLVSLRTMMNLQETSMKMRHWKELEGATGEDIKIESGTTLGTLLDLQLHKFEENIKEIVEKSIHEQKLETTLVDIRKFWKVCKFELEKNDNLKTNILKWNEEFFETLDDHQMQLQNILHSRYIAEMAGEVKKWKNDLEIVYNILDLWFDVQRKWLFMQNIFTCSTDVRVKIPEEARNFTTIDGQLRKFLAQITANPLIIKMSTKSHLLKDLQEVNEKLMVIEKVLNEYLEGKRMDFPRFYFMSSVDLLDILTSGTQPQEVFRHLTKLFDSIKSLQMSRGERSTQAIGMFSKEDEYVAFQNNFQCSDAVEVWLNKLLIEMRHTLRHILGQAVLAYTEKPRYEWLCDWPAQAALCASQIWWAIEVERAFQWIEMGNEYAMKKYHNRQKEQLAELINMLIGELTTAERQKIMTICTIDVHSRDVVAKLIADRIESSTEFQWQSQLRHKWDEDANDCFANICDAEFRYDYEYLGNTPRLVVTPLTDKCYITLTQSLHLFMGGAPAGPAGTGKTETTKDLGRALGMMVYVFNCSEQMDYKSCGNIYKGLAQTGAYGCFDEFNRISVEVLSVVAIQVKSILQALKVGKTTFNFLGETIKLVPTVGIFITMNPGYAGRTELPENLKALFRPCSMIVPDIELICEILLIAEGFQSARALARKFISLYSMCRELLSKQDHYDWGLRAVKSVLVVAGSLKRADPERSEDEVLMRALRDFNTPKITVGDTPIFLGLIGDLFPALDVPRQRHTELEEFVRKAACDLNLKPEASFVRKVTELEEILQVRHSVFIIGDAGVGKSCVWKALFRTYEMQGSNPIYNDLNPKAVTNDELFGVVHPVTREWQDGLFSIIMRDQAYASSSGPKWIVSDGDIDPMWIESLNTVMDDNKVLTLANNERIPLTPSMRLLFEIGHLRTATPATVSRAGILYIDNQVVGYQPLIDSWIERRDSDAEKILLNHLFHKYVPVILEAMHTKFTTIIPLVDVALVQTTCSLLESLLTAENVPPNSPNEWYEIFFVFAAIWGFGGPLYQDQQRNWRLEFHRWWVRTFKTVKFPATDATVFDYHVDLDTKRFILWENLRDDFKFYPEIPLQMTFVDTEETVRLQYLLTLLINAGHPAMIVGGSGCGKTMLVQRKLTTLSGDFTSANIPMNLYTTSRGFQASLEVHLERATVRTIVPRNGKRLIYLVDDINLPQVDQYGTTAPHTVLRQFLDYGHWYECEKYILKNVQNCTFLATMNPNVGSFTINPRLQRHFATIALNFPAHFTLKAMYASILSQHLQNAANKFTPSVQGIYLNVVQSVIDFHAEVCQNFLPTSIKFHYNFNLHDITNVFQGLIFTHHASCPTTEDFFKLLIHEFYRVYADRLLSREDLQVFETLIRSATAKVKKYVDGELEIPNPLLYFHYANGLNDTEYAKVDSWKRLNDVLEEAQENYREIVGPSNLVLFEDAMIHICRIIRILESARGNAMLVGVGGSGKKSLTKLSAFITSLPVEEIQSSSGYGVPEFRSDLAVLYKKTGVKGTKCCLMISDAQIPSEEFVMIINDVLTTGECLNLLPEEDVQGVVQQVRMAAKQQGIPTDRANCWRFFIDRVRNNLKIVLCFSPVGNTIRQRARKLPGMFSNCRIIWFHDWPEEALVSVAKKFLASFEQIPANYVEPISCFMAKVHNSVNEVSKMYLESEKRFNYTTPKTYLDNIDLYRKLHEERRIKIIHWINRLDLGLVNLDSCSEQVDDLKKSLAEQTVVTQEKKKEADKMLSIQREKNAVMSEERSTVAEEEKRVRVIEADIAKTAAQCEEEVKLAEPAIQQAEAALNTLDKKNLTELKSFGTPPPDVVKVTEAVLILFSKGKIPKDRSWKACRAMMGKADTFLGNLKTFDKENIKDDTITAILPYVKDRGFKPELIKSKSSAAAGLCAWVINIHKFHMVYSDVKPKLEALGTAREQLKAEQKKLDELNEKLQVLEDKLSESELQLQAALDEQTRCQNEANQTEKSLDLARRLIDGLSSERVRWRQDIQKHNQQLASTLGDALIAACFVSYMGYFTQSYREKIIKDYWIPTLATLEPRITIGDDLVDLNPFWILCNDAMMAEWNNEGLPSDKMSMDNAMILLSSVRWPLMIDPQLQGIKWIKNRFGDELMATRLDAKDFLEVVEHAVKVGGVLLIENVGERFSTMLGNLFGRVLTRGGQTVMLGDREIDFNPSLRLILQTKLSNPHYQPEVQAQLALINFTVTHEGLEDQLLVDVVKLVRPELEEQQHELTVQRNVFKIQLKELQDKLLERLSGETGNILENSSLVENVEASKELAEEIEARSREAREMAKEISAAREMFRDVAKRAAVLYTILMDMHRVNPIYQYSMAIFQRIFIRAIEETPKDTIEREHVNALIENVTYHVYDFVSRGMFKQDKWVLIIQMFLQLYINSKEYNAIEFAFLLRCPSKSAKTPVSFLSDANWGGVLALSELDNFRDINRDIVEFNKRWELIVHSEMPENEKFPGDWRNMNAVQKLCILRVLRPDRMVYACYQSAINKFGPRFRNIPPPDITKIYQESSSTIPIFFILSPGVDPIAEVEKLGRQLHFMPENGNCHIISLGQGQERNAECALVAAAKEGHWVILQNIHLVAKWLPVLEKCIEEVCVAPHESFRLFMSAEPAENPEYHVLPQGILVSAIKVTNEPPSGMRANLHGALNQFSQDTLETCPREVEFKAILFAMCYFHAIVGERKKFGPAGWNRSYPFNYGDLTFSASVLQNYLFDDLKEIPWDDLRYMFGEIIYGGHITDDWDKRLCHTYLKKFLLPSLITDKLEFCSGFESPGSLDYSEYHKYIDENLPEESPYIYGLHPNVEIVAETTKADDMFTLLQRLQVHSVSTSAAEGRSEQDVVLDIVEDFIDRCHEGFTMEELQTRLENPSPYAVVALQECERMNVLWGVIKKSLIELKQGLSGELTMSNEMDEMVAFLFIDKIPTKWLKFSYPSLLGVQNWFGNLLSRVQQLEIWTSNFALPPVVWLGGLFNPQSLLTAVMQQTARRHGLALDRMALNCDVTDKSWSEIGTAPNEGIYLRGLYLEGARWDVETGNIAEATLMKLTSELPVVYLRAVVSERQDKRGMYECPLYRNRSRGPTYVYKFNIKSKENPEKWVLGGVCLLLEK
ncbi:dynein beta chain, ciliary [Lutzomyia longipalpis]|uniref:dynein beta chain, ciliary n=1 Tax=Lutzomyia longipalpis TaxID=7200 RepID=UPI002483738E|nr:dynein beta chain, ciliary [Lutzomyia longipalpis]